MAKACYFLFKVIGFNVINITGIAMRKGYLADFCFIFFKYEKWECKTF